MLELTNRQSENVWIGKLANCKCLIWQKDNSNCLGGVIVLLQLYPMKVDMYCNCFVMKPVETESVECPNPQAQITPCCSDQPWYRCSWLKHTAFWHNESTNWVFRMLFLTNQRSIICSDFMLHTVHQEISSLSLAERHIQCFAESTGKKLRLRIFWHRLLCINYMLIVARIASHWTW